MKRKLTVARREFLAGSAAGLALTGRPSTLSATPGSTQTKAASTLVDSPQVKRDFSRDGRSKTVVWVAHCALNQNARHVDCADFPSQMKPLLEALAAREIGIVQLPCPELMVLGLGRDRDVPPLDTIREALDLPDGHRRMQPLIEQVIYQIEEYRYQGFRILGILGKNGSPSCGVETTSYKEGFGPGQGIFLRELAQALVRKGIEIPIKGIDDHRQEEAVQWLDQQLAAPK